MTGRMASWVAAARPWIPKALGMEGPVISASSTAIVALALHGDGQLAGDHGLADAALCRTPRRKPCRPGSPPQGGLDLEGAAPWRSARFRQLLQSGYTAHNQFSFIMIILSFLQTISFFCRSRSMKLAAVALGAQVGGGNAADGAQTYHTAAQRAQAQHPLLQILVAGLLQARSSGGR